jgi:hypothetical protein
LFVSVHPFFSLEIRAGLKREPNCHTSCEVQGKFFDFAHEFAPVERDETTLRQTMF